MEKGRKYPGKKFWILSLLILLSVSLACNFLSREGNFGELPQNESSDEEKSALAATYIGVSEIPPFQQEMLDYSIDKNQVVLHVYEDGSVLGEQVFKYSYTQSGVDGALVNATADYNTVFEGTLEDSQGELTGILVYHFVSGGPGASNPQDQTNTIEVVYQLVLSGDVLTGTPTDEEGLFSFELFKQ
ncbi:MAG: hypothetical protein JXA25_04555 [Anaerolineales bacterium]|nr:hypothetical protein [Anaerolineales bacterium]